VYTVHSVVVHSMRIYENSSLKLDNDLGFRPAILTDLNWCVITDRLIE